MSGQTSYPKSRPAPAIVHQVNVGKVITLCCKRHIGSLPKGDVMSPSLMACNCPDAIADQVLRSAAEATARQPKPDQSVVDWANGRRQSKVLTVTMVPATARAKELWVASYAPGTSMAILAEAATKLRHLAEVRGADLLVLADADFRAPTSPWARLYGRWRAWVAQRAGRRP